MMLACYLFATCWNNCFCSDDLSSLGSISFSQVGKRSQQPQFEEVDNEEMENPVVYNELQDSEGYGHLQKRANTGKD